MARETLSRALQLLSTIRQSEFCIALLVLKNDFGYSVVLCKVKQKKSINLLEAVNTAQDIAHELKCLREKDEYEFHQLYIFAQETAKAEDFILKTPRLTSRQTNRCNIAAATDEEHFRLGIFILKANLGLRTQFVLQSCSKTKSYFPIINNVKKINLFHISKE